MAKGPIDIGEENMALNQEDMHRTRKPQNQTATPATERQQKQKRPVLKGQETGAGIMKREWRSSALRPLRQRSSV